MRKYMLACILAFATSGGTAWAQTPTAPSKATVAERVGLVTGDKPFTVELSASKIGVTGKRNRGANCVLHPGDTVTFVTEVAGADPARVEVKRGMRVRLAKPNLATCAAGSHVFAPKNAYDAWEKAQLAAEAEKARVKGTPRSAEKKS